MLACVLEQLNAPLVLRELAMPEPGIGQAQVRITMAGICGAQLQEIRGEKDNAKYLPHLLGHEGVGIVERVGAGVSTVKSGDKVVLHWRKGEGYDAAQGFRYCAKSSGGWLDFNSGPVHTFCTQAIVSENRCTAVPHDTPDELCCLLGCALSTALGVIENEAQVKIGESVLVVGCGGVGLCCIAAAKARGAGLVRGAENSNKDKFRGDTLHIAGWISSGLEFDYIIDPTGNADAIEPTIRLLASGGRYIMVGQPQTGVVLANAIHLFDGGKTIKATQGGCFNPAKDIPRYIAAHRSGALKLDGIVSHRFPLGQVNEALDVLRSGVAGRVMLTMP
jgi:S-(hydroxymethyl)glutathione dehydrogenase / alcohol dehydrogenase